MVPVGVETPLEDRPCSAQRARTALGLSWMVMPGRSIVLAPVRDSVRVFVTAEAVRLMGTVTERLVLRPAAAAKSHWASSLVGLPV